MKQLEQLLKEKLSCGSVEKLPGGASGCISNAELFLIDGRKCFVKSNSADGARVMFDGELAGLEAMQATNTIRVPAPLTVVQHNRDCYIAMEYFDLQSLSRKQADLGERLAAMHLHNRKLKGGAGYVARFGFAVDTCCGILPQDNTWNDSWVDFVATQRVEQQLNRLRDKHDVIHSLWRQVKENLPKLFPTELKVEPSLLHGDLWAGNAGEVGDSPCVFDPAAFYGHDEYDLAIAHMFGGFSAAFFHAYHQMIPKAPGFDKRQKLYQLFHYLNHWTHFGSGYRSSSVSLMEQLARL